MGTKIPRDANRPLDRGADLPIIGDWIGRVGRVLQITSQPCGINPTIAVTAFFAGIPTMMWHFAKPSPFDYLAERTGSPRRKAKWKTTVIATEALPGIGGGGRIITAIFKGLRAAGYYFTVADMLTAGAVNWTSTAYRWSGCTPDAENGCWGAVTCIPDTVELPGAGRAIFTFWEAAGSHLCSVGAGGIAVPGGYIASVGWSLNAARYHPDEPIPEWSGELIDNQGNTVADATPSKGPDGTQTATGFYYNGLGLSRAANKARTNGTYQLYITKGEGFMKWTGGTMTATASPLSDAVTPDP